MFPGFQDIGYGAFYPLVITYATRNQIRHWLATICYRKALTGFNPPHVTSNAVGEGSIQDGRVAVTVALLIFVQKKPFVSL